MNYLMAIGTAVCGLTTIGIIGLLYISTTEKDWHDHFAMGLAILMGLCAIIGAVKLWP